MSKSYFYTTKPPQNTFSMRRERASGGKMFNQKLHSLQTHQHISFRFGQKKEKESRKKENVFQMLKMYTMHSTQLNAIIWLDATHTSVTLPSSFLYLFPITQKERFSYPYRFHTQHQIYPSHLAEVSCEQNFCRMLELMFKLKAEGWKSRITAARTHELGGL